MNITSVETLESVGIWRLTETLVRIALASIPQLCLTMDIISHACGLSLFGNSEVLADIIYFWG
jgi:hypothetical protein